MFDTQAAVGLSAELSAASAAEIRRKGGKPDLWLKKVQKTFAGRRRAGNVQAPPWERRVMGRKRGKMKKTEDFFGSVAWFAFFWRDIGGRGEGGGRLEAAEDGILVSLRRKWGRWVDDEADYGIGKASVCGGLFEVL